MLALLSDVVDVAAAHADIEKLAPRDLPQNVRPALSPGSGGQLEQIQFLLGHLSVQTTERYILPTLIYGPAHGHAIARHIQSSSETLRIATGSLYPALHRLEAQGLVRPDPNSGANRPVGARLLLDHVVGEGQRVLWVFFGAVTCVLLIGVANLVSLGIVAGTVGALALSRLLAAFLFEVPATDPATFSAAIGLFFCAAFVAALVPALRSVRIDPAVALRHE